MHELDILYRISKGTFEITLKLFQPYIERYDFVQDGNFKSS